MSNGCRLAKAVGSPRSHTANCGNVLELIVTKRAAFLFQHFEVAYIDLFCSSAWTDADLSTIDDWWRKIKFRTTRSTGHAIPLTHAQKYECGCGIFVEGCVAVNFRSPVSSSCRASCVVLFAASSVSRCSFPICLLTHALVQNSDPFVTNMQIKKYQPGSPKS